MTVGISSHQRVYRCEYCHTGRYNLCPDMKFFATPPVDGSLARYVTHPGQYCFKLPPPLTSEHGALCEPLSVGIHACNRAVVTGTPLPLPLSFSFSFSPPSFPFFPFLCLLFILCISLSLSLFLSFSLSVYCAIHFFCFMTHRGDVCFGVGMRTHRAGDDDGLSRL